jgi:RND family efflux transporter MFP subunit
MLIRRSFSSLSGILLVSILSASAAACSKSATAVSAAAASEPPVVATAAVESRNIDRYLHVTGSIAADEQAEVSAEVSGRIISTPVERGTRVAAGSVLVTISGVQASAQLAEAEANAAQIEARLGLARGQSFDPRRVPEVMNAKAAVDLAEAEFGRIQSLLDQKVVSRSEYDQRRAQVEAARQQQQMAQNGAEQAFRSLAAARARIALARKAVADTSVRAPFAGLVAERVVSAGDFVSPGTRVATIVRIDPVRVELTVPEHAVSLIRQGQQVRLTVDAYPGQEFVARIRHVAPSLRPEQRALTVEAVAANPDGRLKPGLFATAAIQQPVPAPALLVPGTAVETIAGTSRVYAVVSGQKIEERIVTLGERVGDRVEITSGISKGEIVAAAPGGRLIDGATVKVR